MKIILLIFLFFPISALGQTEESLVVGNQTITYDSTVQTGTGVLYYEGDSLVASDHGTFMLLYQGDKAVLEVHDINGDGEFDAFLTLGENDEVIKKEGEGASFFEHEQPVTFEEVLAGEGGGAGEAGAPEEDLVGSLDSITTSSSGTSMWFFIFLVIFIVGSWWYFRGRENDDE